MAAGKRKHAPLSLLDRLLGAEVLEICASDTPRGCTYRLAELVCYPGMINDIGRTTLFKRMDEFTYSFEIRSKRYLGRGTYIISTQAAGTLVYNPAAEETVLYGRVYQGAWYTLLLSVMTLCVLLSFLLVARALIFLPLFLLMLAIVCEHWWHLLHDKDMLSRRIQDCLRIDTPLRKRQEEKQR